MKLVYLPTAFADVVWMRRYYRDVFPQGAKKAREHLRVVERLIMKIRMLAGATVRAENSRSSVRLS